MATQQGGLVATSQIPGGIPWPGTARAVSAMARGWVAPAAPIPSTAQIQNHLPWLPLRLHQQTPRCCGQENSSVIYFPAHSSLTSLLVLAAGTALHTQTLRAAVLLQPPAQGAQAALSIPPSARIISWLNHPLAMLQELLCLRLGGQSFPLPLLSSAHLPFQFSLNRWC